MVIQGTQNIACQRTFCFNVGDSTTQSTFCQSSESCENTGINTNVMSNSAPCSSNEPDTTTFCQLGRTPIVIPNH